MEAAREALRKGEADLLFGDGIALAFWLNGTDSANCCVFVGGPFTESRYFGEGGGIAVKRGKDTLRLTFIGALFRLWEKACFTDLRLRYRPINWVRRWTRSATTPRRPRGGAARNTS